MDWFTFPDLSWTRKIRHPSEVIRKGESIEVVVLDINKGERRIALGHKQVEANPWDAFEEAYQVGTETTGKIVRLIDKGVIASLPLGVDAFVPLNQLGKNNIKRAADHFKVGDELPLSVIEFDKDNKRIVLSVGEYLKGKEKDVVDNYMSEHALTTTTLKDMVEDVPELEESPEEGKGRKAARKKSPEEEAPAEEATAEESTEEAAEEAPAEDKAEASEEPADEEAKPKKKSGKKDDDAGSEDDAAE